MLSQSRRLRFECLTCAPVRGLEAAEAAASRSLANTSSRRAHTVCAATHLGSVPSTKAQVPAEVPEGGRLHGQRRCQKQSRRPEPRQSPVLSSCRQFFWFQRCSQVEETACVR